MTQTPTTFSRRTMARVADLAAACFEFSVMIRGKFESRCRPDWFADQLFEYELPTAVVDWVRGLSGGQIKPAVQKLFVSGNYTDEVLGRMIGALLDYVASKKAVETINQDQKRRLTKEIRNSLALDGWSWSDGRMQRLEVNAFDVEEQESALESLYAQLGLNNLAQVKHCLRKADEHYIAQNWGDSIKQVRDVLEETLKAALEGHLQKKGDPALDAKGLSMARVVRDKLKSTDFWDEKEKTLIAALYGLLSDQGGHANMSENENARICRQYALSATHFVLLRFQKLHAT